MIIEGVRGQKWVCSSTRGRQPCRHPTGSGVRVVGHAGVEYLASDECAAVLPYASAEQVGKRVVWSVRMVASQAR